MRQPRVILTLDSGLIVRGRLEEFYDPGPPACPRVTIAAIPLLMTRRRVGALESNGVMNVEGVGCFECFVTHYAISSLYDGTHDCIRVYCMCRPGKSRWPKQRNTCPKKRRTL